MFRSMFVRSFWKGSKEIPQRSSNGPRDAFNGIHVIQIPFNVDITGGRYSVADHYGRNRKRACDLFRCLHYSDSFRRAEIEYALPPRTCAITHLFIPNNDRSDGRCVNEKNHRRCREQTVAIRCCILFSSSFFHLQRCEQKWRSVKKTAAATSQKESYAKWKQLQNKYELFFRSIEEKKSMGHFHTQYST